MFNVAGRPLQDELDAAERVVKSNAEIRQVLLEHDQTARAGE